MSCARFFLLLPALSFALTYAAATLNAQSPAQKVAQDTPLEHLGTVATFNGPMPTGATVSLTNRIFDNFPRWGDDVPFTVGEVVDGKAVPYPYASLNDWPGRTSTDPIQYKNQAQNESHFVSVQSVGSIPPMVCRRWKTAYPFSKMRFPGGHKLVAIDLSTNKIVKRILLPSSVAGSASYMSDVRFDMHIGSPAT
jgi:hypothetical protein